MRCTKRQATKQSEAKIRAKLSSRHPFPSSKKLGKKSAKLYITYHVILRNPKNSGNTSVALSKPSRNQSLLPPRGHTPKWLRNQTHKSTALGRFSNEILEHKVEQRREQTKFEVVLTTHGADPATKEQLAQQPHAEITAKLQRTVESQVKENCPTIHGIQKLKSQDIRIHCNTMEEAEQLRKLKWDNEYGGLTVRQSKFGIVIPAVPTELIDPNGLKDPELARQLEHQNKGNGLQIMEMKPMRRKLKDNPRHYHLVIFLTEANMANQCIKHGIYINHQRFLPEKYTPQFQLIQCYKCQRFGHHASTCRSLHDVCAKCSEHHPTSQCNSETHKCAGCKGEHPAWHQDCPHKINEIQNLRIRKRGAPSYFNE